MTAFSLENPHEFNRTYSSVFDDSARGTGNAQSMLDSDLAWRSVTATADEWMQIDLGTVQSVFGVVTQGREDTDTWVKAYTVSTSTDGSTWVPIGTNTATNLFETNAGAGGWGGTCTCPDGQQYEVGDKGNSCGSLSCTGGTSGACAKATGAWSYNKVTCSNPLTGKQFSGNTDRNTKVRQDFDLVSARYVRIYVKAWNGASIGMRAGVVVPAEQFPFGSIRDIFIGPMPTEAPSLAPTGVPTSQAPTRAPTNMPSFAPSYSPTAGPSFAPSWSPSTAPTYSPSNSPSFQPSYSPSMAPTYSPSNSPSFQPSYSPSMAPTPIPSFAPTVGPTFAPTNTPTYSPTHTPTTAAPSFTPTYSPTFTPTKQPTPPPSFAPTTHPTAAPSLAPTPHPTSARQMCMCDAPLAARLPEDEGALD